MRCAREGCHKYDVPSGPPYISPVHTSCEFECEANLMRSSISEHISCKGMDGCVCVCWWIKKHWVENENTFLTFVMPPSCDRTNKFVVRKVSYTAWNSRRVKHSQAYKYIQWTHRESQHVVPRNFWRIVRRRDSFWRKTFAGNPRVLFPNDLFSWISYSDFVIVVDRRRENDSGFPVHTLYRMRWSFFFKLYFRIPISLCAINASLVLPIVFMSLLLFLLCCN